MARFDTPGGWGFSHGRQQLLLWLVCSLLLVLPAASLKTLPFVRSSVRLDSRSPYRSVSVIHEAILPTRRRQRDGLTMSNLPQAHIDVSIDTPLFPVKTVDTTKRVFWKSLSGLLISDTFKVAVVAFVLALTASIMLRGASDTSFSIFWKAVRARVKRWKYVAASKLQFIRTQSEGVPMIFNSTDTDGWGVCTLRSKKRLGKSSFVQYDFDLPRADNVVQLELGQQLSLCCLDNSNSVAKGDFYMYHGEKSRMGTFSILAPNKSPENNLYEVGRDAANFVRVLKEDLKVGDEVALRPGAHRLEYRGQYLPVTDMVYFAAGVGIVPIVEQIKSILPSGSSSVQSVTVVWVNEETDDFDVTAEELEQEYFKYSTKLAVSCVVEDLRANTLEDNAEVSSAVPAFKAGTMAVIAGPEEIANDARKYLINRGYPDDCVCML